MPAFLAIWRCRHFAAKTGGRLPARSWPYRETEQGITGNRDRKVPGNGAGNAAPIPGNGAGLRGAKVREFLDCRAANLMLFNKNKLTTTAGGRVVAF